jgi:hypothetical protein
MLSRLSAIIRRRANGWIVLLLLALFIFTVSVIFPLLSGWLGVPEDVVSIDTQLYYTPAALYDMLAAYGQGREAYALTHFTGDLFFPVVYTLLLACSISWVFKKILPPESRLNMLNLVPLAMFAMDLLENTILAILLLAFPRPLTPLAAAAGVITLGKWLVAAITMTLPLVGLAIWLVRSLRKNRGLSQRE